MNTEKIEEPKSKTPNEINELVARTATEVHNNIVAASQELLIGQRWLFYARVVNFLARKAYGWSHMDPEEFPEEKRRKLE